MATITSFFTGEELQRMDSLVYRARQHGQSTLAHRGVLPGDSDYHTLLVDAADEWFAQQSRPSLNGRGNQIYDHARHTKNRFDGEGAVVRHLQRLNSSLPVSMVTTSMDSWSGISNSAHAQGAPVLSAQRPSTSSISTGVSAQPTTVPSRMETDAPSSVGGMVSKSLPEAGRTQESTQVPLPQAELLRPSTTSTGLQGTTIGQSSILLERQPARDPFSLLGSGSAAPATSVAAIPISPPRTLDAYLSLYATAVIGDRFEEAEGILQDVEIQHSQENAQWICVRTYQKLKRAVTGMERHIPFLVAEGGPGHDDAVSGSDTLQPPEAMASGRGKGPKKKRSAGATPSEFRGIVPQYPWGSAWSFQCLTCDPQYKRRDKAGFNQHMRDVHGHRNFVVIDVHDGVYTWEGIRDTRKEDDEIYGEMVFDEAYSLKYPSTGSKPPDDVDAAYHTANGVGLKMKDRAEEKARKKAERMASKQGKTRTGGTRQLLPRGDKTSVHHAGTDEQADEPNEELDGRTVPGEALD